MSNERVKEHEKRKLIHHRVSEVKIKKCIFVLLLNYRLARSHIHASKIGKVFLYLFPLKLFVCFPYYFSYSNTCVISTTHDHVRKVPDWRGNRFVIEKWKKKIFATHELFVLKLMLNGVVSRFNLLFIFSHELWRRQSSVKLKNWWFVVICEMCVSTRIPDKIRIIRKLSSFFNQFAQRVGMKEMSRNGTECWRVSDVGYH